MKRLCRHKPALTALFLTLLGFGLLAAAGSRAVSTMTVDLSEPGRIAITSDFDGRNLVLFGTVSGDADVAVTVRGPSEVVMVRPRRERMGFWVNADGVRFYDVPAFYWSGSTVFGLEQRLPDSILSAHQIGLDHLILLPENLIASEVLRLELRQALIREKQLQGLYQEDFEPGTVSFNGRLFRADVPLPADVPVGNYRVSFHLIEGDEVVKSHTVPLFISKFGFSARVSVFAESHPALYALIAVLMAAMAGWMASIIFRRG